MMLGLVGAPGGPVVWPLAVAPHGLEGLAGLVGLAELLVAQPRLEPGQRGEEHHVGLVLGLLEVSGGPLELAQVEAGLSRVVVGLGEVRMAWEVGDELLGGAVRKKIRVYATDGPHDGSNWKELAKELVDDGLIAIKTGPTIPVATATDGQLLHPKDLDRALQPFRDVRESVGDQLMMANDGHGKWALPQAIQIAQAMEPLDMMWQEDLMPLLNADSLAELQRSTSTPVCISERLLGRWQFRQFIENGSARIVMPDLIWTGGISETHKIAVMASAHQVPVAPHDATGPVNIFACAQICMSAPNAMIMEHVRDYFYGWYGDFVDPNVPIEHGWLHAPQNPGIGTRLRPEVRDRRDATVRVSDEDVRLGLPDEEWDGHGARSPEMEAEVAEIREWRRPG